MMLACLEHSCGSRENTKFLKCRLRAIPPYDVQAQWLVIVVDVPTCWLGIRIGELSASVKE